jgi:hypothetical protein
MTGDPEPEAYREMRRRNLRLLAQSGNWPEGAVQACEQIEAEHPGWSVFYSNGGWMTWKEAGYYARRRRHRRLQPYTYGATPDELRFAIETHSDDSRPA